MVFSSPIFLFGFFPIFFSIYYLIFFLEKISKKALVKRLFIDASNVFILLSSILFYFWGEAWIVLVMLTSTVVDYVCGLIIGNSGNKKKRKAFLLVSIFVNLSLLGFFKYFNFGLDSFNSIVGILGLEAFQNRDAMEIALPIGISFYTFQSMSYTIDVYRGDVKPTRNIFEFACFVTMFPQLVAGPIVRYRDVASQIINRTVSRELFTSGCLRFIIGLGKKVLIANTVAGAADKIFSIPTEHLTSGLAWLGISCYTLQIYYDFSGYSDMAIGLGRMMGFRFPENFNYPYFAKSIRDFWRRWHISLSSWFRDYVYISLGGSRVTQRKTFFNLLSVFFLCGLWHGASWTFVVWGLFYGGFIIIERWGLDRWLRRQHRLVGHFYVILIVMFGWVLFRAETFSEAIAFYLALIGFASGKGLEFNMGLYLSNDVISALVLGGTFSWPVVPIFTNWIEEAEASLTFIAAHIFNMIYSGLKIVFFLVVGLFAVMSISSGAYNPFIYFKF